MRTWSLWFTSFRRFKWAMRVVALIELFMLTIANLVWTLILALVDIR